MGPTPRSNKHLGLVTPKAMRSSVGSGAVTYKEPCVESEDAKGAARSGSRPTLVGGAVCINQEGSGKAGGAPHILSGGTANAIPTLHGLALNLHEERGKVGGAAQILLLDKGKD
jgi:hypothetical protein